MQIIQTETLADQLRVCPDDVKLWVYNGFDVLLPHEIHRKVEKRMTPNQKAYYDFERNLQGPAISMMLNGVKTDEHHLAVVLFEQQAKARKINTYVQQLANAVWGQGLNVESHIQVKDLFYYDEAGFNLRPKFTGQGGKRRVTTERKALEKIAQENYYARPVVNAILALKEVNKTIEFLERGVEDDGRVHCSFNIAATESGRWSSSHNPWGRGGNFQNQAEEIRRIYVAEHGYVFAYPDLSQAEVRGVAYYSGDVGLLRAVESGDVHTQVAKLVWPGLPWKDDPEEDKKVAALIFYRYFTHRDLAKRGAHAIDYGAMPPTLAKHLAIPEEIAEEFHSRYFTAFPGILRWHEYVQSLLQTYGKLTNALGMERLFLGRLDSRETLKEALAWLPQSLISTILKIGVLRIWREFELKHQWVKLHADMHDGVLMSIKEHRLDEVAPQIIKMMTIPVRFPTGVMTIPVDFTVGYQWQKKKMLKWKPGVLSQLTRPKELGLLDIEASLIEKT